MRCPDRQSKAPGSNAGCRHTKLQTVRTCTSRGRVRVEAHCVRHCNRRSLRECRARQDARSAKEVQPDGNPGTCVVRRRGAATDSSGPVRDRPARLGRVSVGWVTLVRSAAAPIRLGDGEEADEIRSFLEHGDVPRCRGGRPHVLSRYVGRRRRDLNGIPGRQPAMRIVHGFRRDRYFHFRQHGLSQRQSCVQGCAPDGEPAGGTMTRGIGAQASTAGRGGAGRFGHGGREGRGAASEGGGGGGGPGARLAAACGSSSSNHRPRRGLSGGFSGAAGGCLPATVTCGNCRRRRAR